MIKPGNLNIATETIKANRASLLATPSSKLGVTNVPMVATDAYRKTSGTNNPTSMAICPIKTAAIKPIAVESGVGV